MKKLLAVATLLIAPAFAAYAQNSQAEQEILKLNTEYEQAQLNRDAAFFERVLSDDYAISYETGTTENKAQYLEVIRKEKAKPTYKLISLKSEDLKVKVMGNVAVLTGVWMATTAPILDDKAEPQTSKGRYPTVFEKRNGLWMIVTEHMSKAPRDRKLMEQQVLKAGREYDELMKRLKSGRDYSELVKSGDIAALNQTLADEYIYTSREGEISNKAEDLESYKAIQIKNYSAELLEQKVRVIGDSAAVETGTVRYKGTTKGTPFDITKRYTRTWGWRGGRWQIVADHTSAVKQ